MHGSYVASDLICSRKTVISPRLQGYCEDLQATANCFAGDFYLTGDRGVQDEDGYFWFFSRTDDLIISSGYRIGPFEVESALIEHEAVLESAVVPRFLASFFTFSYIIVGCIPSALMYRGDKLSKLLWC